MTNKIASLPDMTEQADLHARAYVESKERTAAQICYDFLRRERQYLTLIQTLMDAGIELVDGRVAYPKWVDYVSRYEDMSPTGRLMLARQPDGDIVVRVVGEDFGSSSVEFCTPMIGGGSSEHTHRALAALMVAMKLDEAETKQHRPDLSTQGGTKAAQ